MNSLLIQNIIIALMVLGSALWLMRSFLYPKKAGSCGHCNSGKSSCSMVKLSEELDKK